MRACIRVQQKLCCSMPCSVATASFACWPAAQPTRTTHLHKALLLPPLQVLWELATKRIPRRGDVAPPPPSDACPAGLSQLIGDCLQLEPERRPDAQQVLDRLKAL